MAENLFGNDPEPGALVIQKAKKKKALVSSTSKVIDAYHDGFVARFGFPPRINGGRDGKAVKEMVAAWGEADVLRLVAWFFRTTNPKVKRSDYSIGALSYLAQGMMIEAREGRPDRTSTEILDAIIRARTADTTTGRQQR